MRKSKSRSALSAGALLTILAGCSNPNTAPAVDPTLAAVPDLCEIWRQANIRAGDKLTRETAAELVALNTGRESMGCPYEPPPKAKKATS